MAGRPEAMTDASSVDVTVGAPGDAVPGSDAALGPPGLTAAPAASAVDPVAPGGVLTRRGASVPFRVHLTNFEGPFDLLLGLISKHKLDITEIAMASVTDEFISHLKAAQASNTEWDLGQASEFLLIAATLLDLKSSRLLPQTGPQDEEDLALIEARDLLFARLLQYRAFKDIAKAFAVRMATVGRMTARQAGLEPQFARLLPELVMGITPEQLAMVAARAMTPKIPPTVALEHLHAPQVSVREQAALMVDQLRRQRACSFRTLVADADSTLVIVARFLALLELFKESAIAFEQAESLGELTVRWTGSADGVLVVSDEFDELDEAAELDHPDEHPLQGTTDHDRHGATDE